jgi:hypothetical protein
MYYYTFKKYNNTEGDKGILILRRRCVCRMMESRLKTLLYKTTLKSKISSKIFAKLKIKSKSF